ncbi:hypothetical protein HY480_01470 [Candidatus Uhrbacteria bacterium]|nr:hypothetical protein [Candidatus Uhrbacteria bacterium]
MHSTETQDQPQETDTMNTFFCSDDETATGGGDVFDIIPWGEPPPPL